MIGVGLESQRVALKASHFTQALDQLRQSEGRFSESAMGKAMHLCLEVSMHVEVCLAYLSKACAGTWVTSLSFQTVRVVSSSCLASVHLDIRFAGAVTLALQGTMQTYVQCLQAQAQEPGFLNARTSLDYSTRDPRL